MAARAVTGTARKVDGQGRLVRNLLKYDVGVEILEQFSGMR